jgi:hypothetical protein
MPHRNLRLPTPPGRAKGAKTHIDGAEPMRPNRERGQKAAAADAADADAAANAARARTTFFEDTMTAAIGKGRAENATAKEKRIENTRLLLRLVANTFMIMHYHGNCNL